MAGTIVGIYRKRNADHVRRLLEPAVARGWHAALWALDETDPSLAQVTVGQGEGLKLPLLNATLARAGSQTPWTVFADDDVRFDRGDIVHFVKIAERCGFDLAQPARAQGTHLSHGITAAVRLSRARETSFVESGPLWAVGPRFRDRVLPLPDARGMGWGVEIDWYDLRSHGCRLGIVDGIQMEHLGRTAEDYDDTEIRRRLLEELAARGHPKWAGMRQTLSVWRPWQPTPPWLRGGER